MTDTREFLTQWFAERNGVASFEDFMAAALYHPKQGYYTAHISEVGGDAGDFATSATLSQALGRAIARWIEDQIRIRHWQDEIAVIEVGAGNGALAKAVLASLSQKIDAGVRYRIVEVSPRLEQIQRRDLAGEDVEWFPSIHEALSTSDGRALIISNELIDAFPVKWLRRMGGKWREIWVRFDPEKGLREEFHNFHDADEFVHWDSAPEGQRVEIRPAWRNWLKELVSAWREGSMLMIDYGAGSWEDVYERRPGGSLRGYWKHQRIEGAGVYARFGKQDLTSDVVFSQIASWGESMGLTTQRLETQQQFLAGYGEGRDLMAGTGPGEAFWVLEQKRD